MKTKSYLLSFFGRWIFQCLFLSNNISVKGEKNLLDAIKSEDPVMICVWHGRLLFPSWYIRRHTSLHIISSRHPDSEILARILRHWGYKLIRGSTSKGGSRVIREMTKIFNNGGIIAVTNDGPKGPLRIAKSGSISLAFKKNIKIISVTGSATRYWQAKSWDQFMLPKPFGKIQIIVSPPLKIDSNPATTNEEVNLLTNFINQYQDEADRMAGKLNDA